MKKKYKLKGWVKVAITVILISLGIIIYHIVSLNGAYATKSVIASIFICLGWFWLIFGQIMTLYFIWEE